MLTVTTGALVRERGCGAAAGAAVVRRFCAPGEAAGTLTVGIKG